MTMGKILPNLAIIQALGAWPSILRSLLVAGVLTLARIVRLIVALVRGW